MDFYLTNISNNVLHVLKIVTSAHPKVNVLSVQVDTILVRKVNVQHAFKIAMFVQMLHHASYAKQATHLMMTTNARLASLTAIIANQSQLAKSAKLGTFQIKNHNVLPVIFLARLVKEQVITVHPVQLELNKSTPNALHVLNIYRPAHHVSK